MHIRVKVLFILTAAVIGALTKLMIFNKKGRRGVSK